MSAHEPLTLTRPAWHNRALCATLVQQGADPDAWHDPDHPDTDNARAACSVCPVREPCHDAGRLEYGIWGGEHRNRRATIKSRPAA